MTDSRYLELWTRMNSVVQAYVRAGRTEEADYHIADFFGVFDRIDELERHINIAEETAEEQGVL